LLDAIAEARLQVVVRRTVGEIPGEQAGLVDALQFAGAPVLSIAKTSSASGRNARTTGVSPSTCSPR
jgi:hypothetical protein